MAQDATGTPTALWGIPKYNTAVDPPSGKGFNAVMDFIDGIIIPDLLLDAKGDIIAATAADTAARLAVGSNGTYLRANSATSTGLEWGSAAGSPGYGTSLPGSPTDGEEYVLVDNATTPTYHWRFRYHSGSGNTDKWEFMGGTPARHEIATLESSSNAAYVDLTTPGPTITVPRAGVYVLTVGAYSHNTGAVASGTIRYASIKIGGAATADTEALIHGEDNASVSMTHTSSVNFVRTLAASDVLKVQYKMAGGAGSGEWAKRSLLVTPVRVS